MLWNEEDQLSTIEIYPKKSTNLFTPPLTPQKTNMLALLAYSSVHLISHGTFANCGGQSVELLDRLTTTIPRRASGQRTRAHYDCLFIIWVRFES